MSWGHIPLAGNTEKGKTKSVTGCWGAAELSSSLLKKISDDQIVCDPPSPGTCPPYRPSQGARQPGGTVAAQDVEHTAAVDSSVTTMQYRVFLLACKSNDFRTHFCHLWQRKHVQAMGVYLWSGEYRRKSLGFPLQPLISVLLAFLVGRVCPVATFMVRHSSFWCSEKKIMTILNLYFSE